jgi:hypothetical protein
MAESLITIRPPDAGAIPARPGDSGRATSALIWTVLSNAAVGIAAACYFFGRSFPAGAVSAFRWPQGDFQQYLTGAKFFIYDAWRFPLFISAFVERSYPQSMAFTDCIPLFALIAKLVYKTTGDEIPYLAWWYILVLVAQPLSFGLLLWSAGIRSKILIAAGGILSLLVPTFLYRGVHHAALFGHFIPITAIALYFVSAARRPWPRWIWVAWPLWLLVAASINLYLLGMAGAFFVAALAQAAWLDLTQHDTREIAIRALYAAGTAAAIALLMLTIGYFVPYELEDPYTLELTGTNLLSPFVPQMSGLFPRSDAILDPTGAQYEGYNYLGAGFLLLVLTAIALRDRRPLRLLVRHPALSAVLLALAVFALSTSVYLGHVLLVSYSLPDFLSIYRSAGRFVWPVTYFALFLSLYTLESWRPLWRPGAVIATALLLQWQDVRGLSGALWELGHDTAKPALDSNPAALRALIAQHQGVYMAPEYGCSHNDQISSTNRDIVWYAALEHRPVNTIYFSRRPIDEDCGIDKSRLADRLERGYLVAVFYDWSQEKSPLEGFTCIEHDIGEVCLASRKVDITEDFARELLSPDEPARTAPAAP